MNCNCKLSSLSLDINLKIMHSKPNSSLVVTTQHTVTQRESNCIRHFMLARKYLYDIPDHGKATNQSMYMHNSLTIMTLGSCIRSSCFWCSVKTTTWNLTHLCAIIVLATTSTWVLCQAYLQVKSVTLENKNYSLSVFWSTEMSS